MTEILLVDQNNPLMPPTVDAFKPSPELEAAAQAFTDKQKEKTYSERHPELGKMIRCRFCRLRHRAFQEIECALRQSRPRPLLAKIGRKKWRALS